VNGGAKVTLLLGALSAALVLAIALRSRASSPIGMLNLVESRAATSFSLDTVGIDGSERIVVGEHSPHRTALGATQTLVLNGWAVDSPASTAAGGVFLQTDNGARVACDYGIARPDVARVLGLSSFTPSGFTCRIEGGDIGKGRHSLGIGIVATDWNRFYFEGNQVEVDVRG